MRNKGPRAKPFRLTVSYLDEVAHIVKNDNSLVLFIWRIAVELRRQRDEAVRQRRELEEVLRRLAKVANEADSIAWNNQNSERYPLPGRMPEC